jgi:hypothetical protein
MPHKLETVARVELLAVAVEAAVRRSQRQAHMETVETGQEVKSGRSPTKATQQL